MPTIPSFDLRSGVLFPDRRQKFVPAALPGVSLTDFYCDPVNGNNMNGGSDQNGSPVYSSTNGNWNGSSTFIPSDSSNPAASGVQAGQFAHVFNDGSTTPVYVARVVSADSTQIILSTTAKAGTVPTSSATARSIRVGGAFKGPNGSVWWPISTNFASATNVAGKPLRLNMRSNALYSVTASSANNFNGIIQGYANTVGDGGKANLDGGGNNINFSTNGGTYYDMIFSNTSNGNGAITNATGLALFRCVFHDCAGTAIQTTSGGLTYFWIIECEFYKCQTANTALLAAVMAGNAAQSVMIVMNSYFHDCPVSNGHGILLNGQNVALVVVGCIFDTLGGSAIASNNTSNANQQYVIAGCSFYNITGSAFANLATLSVQFLQMWNNMICKCGGYGLDGTIDARLAGYAYNTVWGAGTMACRKGRVNFPHSFQFYNDIQLAPDVSPWVAPDTGNFTLASSLAVGGGRGNFIQTGSNKSGTLSYVDVGATQAAAITRLALPEMTWADGVVGTVYVATELFSDTIDNAIVISGTLPAGLQLVWGVSNTVMITGTPTTAGASTFTVRLLSGSNQQDYINHITINAATEPASGGVGGG